MILKRIYLSYFLIAFMSALTLLALPAARAAEEGPDEMIRRLSTDVLNNIKADKDVQKGDVSKITAFVDSKVMPNVNFTRMTVAIGARRPPSNKNACKMSSKICWCALTPVR